MLLVAFPTVRRDRLDDYRRFEREAARIMARHGGAIERVLVLDDGAVETLRELHIVRFADEAGWSAYRADPRLAELADLRASAIVDTLVWPAVDSSL